MPSPLTLEQATTLRDKGAITPATFSRLYPDTGGTPAVQPPMAPPPDAVPSGMAAPAPGPAPADVVPSGTMDPDEARRESQRALFQEHKAGIARAETAATERMAAMEAEAADKRATDAQADVVSRRDMAIRMGVSPKEADEKLKGDVERAATLSSDAIKARQVGLKTGTDTAPGDDVSGGAVKLASDTAPGGIAPGGGIADALNKAMGSATAGYDQQERGVRLAADAGKLKAAEEQAFLERTQKEDKARVEANVASEAERKAKLDEAFGKMDQATTALAAAKVDPDHFWASKTTGQKVTAGIGLFLGAFGASGAGGNKAVAVIQDSIDKDIAAQKSNIDIQKATVEARSGIYRSMLDTFKDRRAAEEATRSAYLDNAQLQVKAIAAKYAGTELEGKAQTLIGELEIKKQEARTKFAAAVMARMPVGAEANPEALKPDQRERFVPGYGLALTKEDAAGLKTHLADAQSTKGNIRRLLSIGATGGKSTDMQLRSEAQTLASILKGQLRTPIVGPGAVSESEWKLLDDIVADPTKLWSLDNTNKKRLETISQYIDRQTASKVTSAGLVPASQRIGFTAAAK